MSAAKRVLDRDELLERARGHPHHIREDCDGYHSPHQQRQAGAAEARLRERKAATLRRLQAGDLDLAWVLRADKPWFTELTLGEVLRSTRYVGRLKVRWLAKHAGVRMMKPIGEIPLERREYLITLIAINFAYVKLGDLDPMQAALRAERVRFLGTGGNWRRHLREKGMPAVPIKRMRYPKRAA